MQANSRTNLVLKNIAMGIFGQLFTKIIGFISRTIFIQMLGVVYLGLNGLFSNILSILSLAELGVGSAIVFSLYKPLADKDEKLIESYVNLYSKAYKIIGITIFSVGLIVIPFIDLIIKDRPDIPNLIFIYILYLSNTSVSYFFSYKRALFTADQKNYINILYDNVFNLITVLVQVIVLITTSNFVLYLTVQIIFTLLSNMLISFRANKEYPYITSNEVMPIPQKNLMDIKKNIKSMFLLKIGGVAVNSTDNLLISSFIGITSVGLYSNYLMIISIIQTIIIQIFTPVTASVGNLVNLESKEKTHIVFNNLFFLNYLIYNYVSVNLFVYMNPFIKLWIGDSYTFPLSIVFIIVLNIYLMGMRRTLWVFTNALGLFYNFRFVPFIEATVNLGASLILLKKYGIIGVFLGTTISTISTYLLYEPYVVFKSYFLSGLKEYFKKYLYYFITTITSGYVIYQWSLIYNVNDWIDFIVSILISTILLILMLVFFSIKQTEFKYVLRLAQRLFIHKNK